MNVDHNKSNDTRLRDIWSVHEFARQNRLSKMEESRLKMLHGSFAPMDDLLGSQLKKANVW
jgi:hypothetical protein